MELVKQRIEVTDNKLKAAFVVSRAIKGTKIGTDIIEVLSGYGLPILSARLTQRVSYPVTASNGTTVLDTEPNSEASKEITYLIHEIKNILI